MYITRFPKEEQNHQSPESVTALKNSIQRIGYQISNARMPSENLNKEPYAVVNAK